MMQQKPGRSNYFVGALVDAIAPTVTFFALHALGAPTVAALVVGSLVALVSTIVNTVRRKRLDGVGLLVLAEIGASILLQILVRDPRLLLIKPSFYSGIGGIYLLFTAFGERPLTYEGARPMATKGDPERAVAYERAWRCSPAFRALHRGATLGWAAAFLADALLRVIMVYHLPIDRAVWLGNVPHIAAIMLLIGFSALIGREAKPLVDEQLVAARSLPATERGAVR